MAGNGDRKRVGVLALQGGFEQHEAALSRAGADPVNVRTAAALSTVDGLILPGGESTTMLKLIGYEQLWDPLAEFLRAKPVLGTCAGAILLARDVEQPKQASFGALDITVERNGYGRQIDSHIAQLELDGQPLEAVFIRAPIIRRVGEGVDVLAAHRGDPVLVRQGHVMAATFHPELTCDPRVHALFLQSL